VAGVGWVNQLRNALDEDNFELRFQPINDIHTGETTHHEVLIRLRGEDGKIILPDAFLASAVRFGMMSEIDFWIIENAARAYAKYSQQMDVLKLSINLSANAFESDDLVQHVRQAFDTHNVDPRHIIFEITESLAIRHPVVFPTLYNHDWCVPIIDKLHGIKLIVGLHRCLIILFPIGSSIIPIHKKHFLRRTVHTSHIEYPIMGNKCFEAVFMDPRKVKNRISAKTGSYGTEPVVIDIWFIG
jgi:hypothetical protein